MRLRALCLLVGGTAVTAAAAGAWVTRLRIAGPLGRLAAELDRVGTGDAAPPVTANGPALVVEVARAAEAMRARLLGERSTAARRSLLIGQEDERRRLAMGIHDDTVQSVLAASLRLQRLRRHLRAADHDGTDLVLEVQHDLDEAISRLRRLVFELHPPTLDRNGLVPAMRLYLEETLDPEGVAWTVSTTGDEVSDDVTAALVYRLFREAVLNSLRHANATTVDVTVDVNEEDVLVTVRDDGVGFDPGMLPAERPGHLGMEVARTLCEGVGGRWQVESAPGRGTQIRLRVPRAVV